MKKPRTIHPLIAWLCLVCFGLGGCIFGDRVVICQQSDGSSRLEWSVCDQDETGHCLADRIDEACDSLNGKPAKPCKDTPLGDTRHVARIASRPAHQQLFPPVALAAVPLLLSDAPLPRLISRWARSAEKPPNALTHLRTVVMLV